MIDVEELKCWYNEKLQKQFTNPNDLTVSIPGARFVVEQLEEANPGMILEMGSGFTTLVFRAWKKHKAQPQRTETVKKTKKKTVQVWTAEHNPEWLAFTRQLLSERQLSTSYLNLLDDRFRAKKRPKFDFIFVDHGPELITRIADSRWLASLLTANGRLVFDDWRPRFAHRITAALEPLGFTFYVAEHTRRSPRDKAIAVARKTRPAQKTLPPIGPLLTPRRRSPKRRGG